MKSKIPVTIAEGDGIGPEIMAATLHVLEASGAPLEFRKVDIGEKVYLKGHKSGIEPSTWETIRNSKGFLKAPITTPQGGGFKSLNVTIRTTLGLYANIRPCVAYAPFVKTKHPDMNVVIVRENEEDLYMGIEYQQTPDTVQALKIMTRPGCERIIRYAFDYAHTHGRKKVTCFSKDNILKLSDGLFHRIFDDIAKEYPTIENEHWIIDIGAAKLADTPEIFDVIVMPNLYGDILSDVGAQIAGSVGLAGSANIGPHAAMFEAIHGSAPRRAGQNIANPSGLLLASVLMLVHMNLPKEATLIHNAWLSTIEDGIHTYDIYDAQVSKKQVGTKEFAQAVAARMGKQPHTLQAVQYVHGPAHKIKEASLPKPTQKEIIGVDIFVQMNGHAETLALQIHGMEKHGLKLTMIANRGVRVWPEKLPETLCGDTWRCRFMSEAKGGLISNHQIVSLLQSFSYANIDFTQVETLCAFNGQPAFTLAQDEQ